MGRRAALVREPESCRHSRSHRAVRARNAGRHEHGGERGPSRVSVVVRRASPGARSLPVQGGRDPRRALRAIGRRDDARGRQNAARGEGRGPPRDQHPAVLRRRRGAPAGTAGAIGARARLRLRRPQATRRRGTRHAVEFPQRHSSLETGARARRGEHRRPQARVGGAAEQLADRRSSRRGRRAGGRRELRRRAGRRAGRRHGGRRRDESGFLYGLVRGWCAPLRPSREAPPAGAAGNGREEPDRGAGRCRSGPRGGGYRRWCVRVNRAEVHGDQPCNRRGVDP